MLQNKAYVGFKVGQLYLQVLLLHNLLLLELVDLLLKSFHAVQVVFSNVLLANSVFGTLGLKLAGGQTVDCPSLMTSVTLRRKKC